MKNLLFLLLLPSLSWGAACVVPPEQIKISGIWPHQTLDSFDLEQNGRSIIINYDYDLVERIGTLNFENFDDNYRIVDGIGEVFIGHVHFKQDYNKISSYAISPMDLSSSLESRRVKLTQATGVPSSKWKKKSDELYSYTCNDYELSIVQQKDRGDIALVVESIFEKPQSNIKQKYKFSAKELLSTNVQRLITVKNIHYSNYDLYENDPLFKNKLDEVFFNKTGLDIKDFDMGKLFSNTDIINGVLTTYFWQKNSGKSDNKLELHIAYNPMNNKMLVVTVDEVKRQSTFGDSDKALKNAIIKSHNFAL